MGIMNFPLVVCFCSLLCMWASAHLGLFLQRTHNIEERDQGDFGRVVGATLTLLGLLIGFTFSMAIHRYDQRKNYEEEEAKAMGATLVHLDTFDWQAKDFYLKHGYEIFGVLDDCPPAVTTRLPLVQLDPSWMVSFWYQRQVAGGETMRTQFTPFRVTVGLEPK